MNPQVETASPATKKGRWRRFLFWLLGITVVVIGAWIGATLQARNSLDAVVAETDRLDPGWRLSEIRAAMPPISEAENSVTVMASGRKLVTQLSDFDALDIAHELMGNWWEAPNERLTGDARLGVEALLGIYGAGLVEFRKIADMPRGGGQEIIVFREALFALVYDCVTQVEAENGPQAFTDLRALINTATITGDLPEGLNIVPVSYARALTMLERCLAQMQLSDSQWEEIQRLCQRESENLSLLRFARVYRASLYDSIQSIRREPAKDRRSQAPWNSVGGVMSNVKEMFPGQSERDWATILNLANQLVELAKLPEQQQCKAVLAWQAEVAREKSYVAGCFGGEFHRLACQAELRCAVTAIAAERFRLRFGKWPQTLEDLVSVGLITSVPVDPCEPNWGTLRWKTTSYGRVVYSLGSNTVDDAGEYSDPWWTSKRSDNLIRLYDVEHRRVSPSGKKAAEAP